MRALIQRVLMYSVIQWIRGLFRARFDQLIDPVGPSPDQVDHEGNDDYWDDPDPGELLWKQFDGEAARNPINLERMLSLLLRGDGEADRLRASSG